MKLYSYQSFYPQAQYAQNKVSFCSMKKSEFDGVDFAVVEKYKAPIEKFDQIQDFYDWAGVQAQVIIDKDYPSRQQATNIQRKGILKDWKDHVLNRNDTYTNATALLIFDALTKDLRPDNDKLPPTLNKNILADCLLEIDANIKQDRKYQFSLGKVYQAKLREQYCDAPDSAENTFTKWIIIPSQKRAPQDFQENVKKMKTLSHKNWCTSTYHAEPYLLQGDFHVYIENGKPQLGIRFVDDKAQEIEGELNNSKIPQKYLEVLKNYLEANEIKLGFSADGQLNRAQALKKRIDDLKKDIQPAIDNEDYEAIFKHFGMHTMKDKDGYLILSHFAPPKECNFEDMGLDINKMLKNVRKICGDADFSNMTINGLGDVKTIGGNANFKFSQINNLGNLEKIEGVADFTGSQVINTGKLKTLGSSAYFNNSKVKNFNNLEVIEGSCNFDGSEIEHFGKLKRILGNAYFVNSIMKSLENLEYIGGNADFRNSSIEDLGNLKTIQGNADFSYSRLKTLSKLETIYGNAIFTNSSVTDLCKLKLIGGNADFNNSPVKTLANLETIGRNLYAQDSSLEDLGKLKSIGEKAFTPDKLSEEVLKLCA